MTVAVANFVSISGSFGFQQFSDPAVAGTGGTASGAASVNISSVSISGTGAATIVTVTTSGANPFVMGESVTIAGNTGGANINGTFTVSTATSTQFTYASANAAQGTGGTVAGTVSGSITNVSLSSSTVTVTTSFAKYFAQGESVTIAGNTGGNNMNGTFTVVTASATQFTYTSNSTFFAVGATDLNIVLGSVNGTNLTVTGASLGLVIDPSSGYALEAKVAPAFTGTTTTGSPTVTNITNTAGLFKGMTVSGTGIPLNTQILSVDSLTQITLTNNATAAGAADTQFRRRRPQTMFPV